MSFAFLWQLFEQRGTKGIRFALAGSGDCGWGLCSNAENRSVTSGGEPKSREKGFLLILSICASSFYFKKLKLNYVQQK